MMKRFFALLLLAAFLLPGAACANGWGLPGGLPALFEHNPAYADHTMQECDAQTDKNRPGDVAVFVMESRYHNELFVARKADGAYRIDAQSTAALRQTGWDDSGLDIALLTDDLFELRYPGETYRFRYQNEYEGWCLDSAHIASSGLTLEWDARSGGYIATENGEEAKWLCALHLSSKNACGHLQYDAFSLSAMPRTLAALRAGQHADSLLPMGQYTEELYSGLGDAQLPVYSAPDTSSMRFAGGKAAVSLQGSFLALDWRDGFVMVHYDVSPRTARVGYVQATDALAQALTASGWQENDFQYVSRWGRMDAILTADAPLTDDPFVSGYPQLTLPAGTRVTALSAWNALYAVVETTMDGQRVRGFVPLWMVDIPEPPVDETGMQALAGTAWEIYAGGYMYAERIHYRPDGTFVADWLSDASGEADARTGRYAVSRADPAWGLYWHDVPYMITYTDGQSGSVLRFGMDIAGEGLSLYTEEGSGGFLPYDGEPPAAALPRETPEPPPTPTPEPSPGAGARAVVNNPNPADRLHLRQKADRNSASLGKFYNGTPVLVTARENGWAKVSLGANRNGFMMETFLAFGEDAQRVASAFPAFMPNEPGGAAVLAQPDPDSPVLFTDTGDALVIGVHGNWLVLQSPEGVVGYAPQSSYDMK